MRNLDQVMQPTSMLVAGVGGAGCNALNHMLRAEGSVPEAVALHTDETILSASLAPRRFQLGAHVTAGLSTGGEARRGRIAAEQDESHLRDILANHHLVVFLVGLGGGTGSGAIPVLARLAREMGILTLVIATQPFWFEGEEKKRNADTAMSELRGVADAVLSFPNDRLFEILPTGSSVKSRFELADRYLVEGILAIWQMMNQRGLIHLDFADVQRLVRHSGGLCTLATITLPAREGAHRAVEALLSSPLMDRGQIISRAQGAILGITAGPELPLEDIQTIVREFRSAVSRAELHFAMGVVLDPTMAGKLRLLLLVTEEWNTPCEPAKTSGTESADSDAPVKKPKIIQGDLALGPVDDCKGRFKDVEATIVDGQDLDTPTYLRKNIRIGS